VTDRYTKAVEQLGSDKLEVRIGGIYALERIACDSARDHPTVMDVLTAFIREHSHEQWPLSNGAHGSPVCTATLSSPLIRSHSGHRGAVPHLPAGNPPRGAHQISRWPSSGSPTPPASR
jgi:hypothetical protein